MQNIFVVTHAQSQHQIDNRVGGWFDTGLTKFGQSQAESIADRLSAQLKDKVPYLVTSDLKRAAETATIISKRTASPLRLDARFRENSYGIAEGRRQDWLDAHMSIAPDNNRLDHRIIEGAETKREFVARIYAGMSDLPEAENIVIVSHGYALTFIVSYWIGLPLKDAGYVNFRAFPGGLTFLQADDLFRNRAVRYLSDTSHL